MFPICRYFVPNFVFEPSGIPDRDRKDFLNMIAVTKLLITNTKLATNAFLQKKLSLFDPIVHENSCQIRAFRVITLASCEETLHEARKLNETAVAVEKTLGKLQNKLKVPFERVSFDEIITTLNLSLEASPEMIYLLQSYFLTIGKVFQMKPDGSERAYIDYPTLQSRVSKQINMISLKEIVDFTQVRLAEASVRFIQAEAHRLGGFIEAQLEDGQIEMVESPDKDSLARPCSCAFYNFKAILLRAREENILISVKKYAFGKEKSFGVFYQASKGDALFAPLSDEDVVKLNPKTPVFAIEGFVPDSMEKESLQKHIDEISLMDLALMNVARVSQFSSLDIDPKKMDPKAYEEITEFRKKAKEIGCSLEQPRAFSIVHTHAGVIEEML